MTQTTTTQHDCAGGALPLQGRAAIVTGSTSGIGRGIAVELAARGASVVITSRSQERADTTAAELGGDAIGVGIDLTEDDAAERLVQRALDAFDRLDILVNCAGAAQVGDTDTLPLAEWDRIIKLYLTVPFRNAQAASRPMFAAGGGVIVNISSVCGHAALARRGAYTAAKHGLEGLTKVLAVEWAQRGVRVVTVAPTYVVTEHMARTSQEAGDFNADVLVNRTPMRRLARPETIGRVVAFMASDDAELITGSGVLVDGGWLADGGWEHGD